MTKKILVALTFFAFSASLFAQPYPNRPIRMVVPYPPGGSTDLLARIIALKVGQSMGQTIVVENRGGAGGTLGSELASRAAPDGYTILLGANATHAIVKSLYKQLPYDPVKDFTPLTAAVEVPTALVVHPSFPANTAREFVEYAKKNPGKISFGSSGTGSPHHLTGELLKQFTAVDMVHVPYKGAGPAVQDLIGNQIPAVFTTLSTALPLARQGKLKILGVAEGRRAQSAPDVPTIGESIPGFAMPSTWLGFFGPAGLPMPIVKRLNTELLQALNSPDTRGKLEAAGMQLIGTSAEEFGNIVRRDIETFRKIIIGAGIQPE